MSVVHIFTSVVLLVAISNAASQDGVTIRITGPVKIIIGSGQDGHGVPTAVHCGGRNGLPEKQGCPEGFSNLNGSRQCFKLFNDEKLNWYESKHKCTSEGLRLAEPSDEIAVDLRKYLHDTYGDISAWLGARGDGSAMVWQSSDTPMSYESPLITPNIGYTPSRFVNVDTCLSLSTVSGPETPYGASYCKNNPNFPLCEVRM